MLDRGGRGAPVTALGGLQCSSYGVKDVSLLLRWNRNANETERAAARLWDAVRGAAHVDLPGGGHIQFIRPLVPGPVPLNADESGVYEYRIEISIYYRR